MKEKAKYGHLVVWGSRGLESFPIESLRPHRDGVVVLVAKGTATLGFDSGYLPTEWRWNYFTLMRSWVHISVTVVAGEIVEWEQSLELPGVIR